VPRVVDALHPLARRFVGTAIRVIPHGQVAIRLVDLLLVGVARDPKGRVWVDHRLRHRGRPCHIVHSWRFNQLTQIDKRM
jgi:hypothetical protein